MTVHTARSEPESWQSQAHVAVGIRSLPPDLWRIQPSPDTETNAVETPGQISLTVQSFRTSWEPKAGVSPHCCGDMQSYRKGKPDCERILETVLSNRINEDDDSAFCEALDRKSVV